MSVRDSPVLHRWNVLGSVRNVGKASRKSDKATQRDKIQERTDRALRSFYSKVGLRHVTSAQAFWGGLEQTHGEEFADELERLIGLRHEGEKHLEVYDLIYQDLDTAIATFHLSEAFQSAWMKYLRPSDLRAKRILDAGSGWGLVTCFVASCLPESEVVGVELSNAGVDCARALAERLGLANVSFIQGDLHEVQLDGTFDLVLGSAVLWESLGDDLVPEPDRPVFSDVNSVRGFDPSEVAGLRNIANHLAPEGTYLAAERLGGFREFYCWLEACKASGLRWDPASSAALQFHHQGMSESIPVTALKLGLADWDLSSALEWWCETHTDPVIELEKWLIDSEEISFIDGLHLFVEDAYGPGQTRVYLLEAGGQFVIYRTTSRGFRGVEGLEPGSTRVEAERQFSDITEDFKASPEVVGTKRLSRTDFEQDRPSL